MGRKGGRYFYFSVLNGTTPLITNQILNAGRTHTLNVPIEQRLPNPSSTINFVINSFQDDSNMYDNDNTTKIQYGATLSSGKLYTNSQILPSSNVYPNDIKITIYVSNDT
jgi:hypothetical protein